MNLTTNQHSDTFWVQSEWIVHNLQFRTKFCDIYNKSVVVIVKNLARYGRTPFFDKNQKLTANT